MTVKGTLTGCEFTLLATVTNAAVEIRVASHTDHICCSRLQVSGEYFIVTQSIVSVCCDIFRHLDGETKEYKKTRVKDLSLYSKIKLPFYQHAV